MEPGAAVLATLSPIHPLGLPRPLFRGCWRGGGALDEGSWVPLGEAVRRFANEELVTKAEGFRAKWRQTGHPTYLPQWQPPADPYLESYQVPVLHPDLAAARKAEAGLKRSLHAKLAAGELLARGRPGSLAADSRVIPATLWSHLKILNAGRGILIGIDRVRWYGVEVARSVDVTSLPGPVRPVTVPKRRKATEREIIDFMVKLQLGGSVKSMEADREAFLEAHPDLTAPVKYFQDIRGPYALKKGRPPKPK